ncbi:MAG TPA: BTAD domain-containing putative transcriptional regulator, partial [Ilumatobacter sp.]
MIQVAMLGPLEVYVDGDAVALGGPRQRAVLGRLLLAPRRVVSADRIIEDVWDGHPPDTARKTLHKYVFELRKALPALSLRTAPAGYVLDVDDEAIDSRRFERLVAERRFAAALALWRGEPLADLPDLGFLAPERARLGELRLFAIESRVEDDLEAGRHGSVIGELTDLVEAHPLRERLTGSLMLALYRAGRQVEALRTFERHRRQLEEIGVEPAAALRELEDAILRHDPRLECVPATASLASSSSPGNVPNALTSFVGRADERAAVVRALDGNRLVTISGPGGIGKTRLAQHVGQSVTDRFPGGVWMVDLAGIDDAD